MPTFDEAYNGKPKPVVPKQPAQSNPRPIPTPYKDIKVDSRVLPKSALLAHIEGSQVFPDRYYSQILAEGNNPIPFSIDLPAVSQQYNRIDRLEFRIQDGLSNSFKDGENEFEVTGSSVIYAGIVPNVHDVFIMDIGDGKLGRFEVTMSKPLSYTQAAVHEISYKLVDYLTPAVQANLDLKTNETYTYARDQFMAGRRGILLEQEYSQYEEMRRLLATLPGEYYREFYSREYRTLVVPDQMEMVYDSFVVQFFKRMLDVNDHPWLSTVHELSVDLGYGGDIFTLFDAALNNDETILDRCYSNIQPVDTNYFRSQPLYANIAYSGINATMFPVGIKVFVGSWEDTIFAKGSLRIGPNVALNRKVSMDEAYSRTRMDEIPGSNEPARPWISDDIFKESYIFSKAFYQNLDSQSALELMFRSAVRGQFKDAAKIIKACNDRVLWTSTTRFYYMPILFYILRTAIINVS